MADSPYATLDDWLAREVIPFALEDSPAFDSAVDRMMAALGDPVDLLGLGEGLHGGSDILALRNRLFRRLVEAHGFNAIAVESSFPRGRLVNDYVAGRGPDSFDEVREAGFSHGFGQLEANRELVEWMRAANADPARRVPLRFYGFDSPTEMVGTDSPRQLLTLALDALAALDSASSQSPLAESRRDELRRERIEALLGQDADWENPAASFDPAQGIGLSPAAAALRLETEDLITELSTRRPELVARGGPERCREVLHCAGMARWLLAYHAALARPSDDRISRLLGMRDAVMADTLVHIAASEQARQSGRGWVLVFAHNGHLQRSRTEWQLGPHRNIWWPAGAHLSALLGPRWAAVGSGVGVSEANGIGQPDAGTLEARLMAAPGPLRFIPTHRGAGLPAQAVEALPTRSTAPAGGSARNSTYFPLTARSLSDFDALVVLDTTGYAVGAPPLPPAQPG